MVGLVPHAGGGEGGRGAKPGAAQAFRVSPERSVCCHHESGARETRRSPSRWQWLVPGKVCRTGVFLLRSFTYLLLARGTQQALLHQALPPRLAASPPCSSGLYLLKGHFRSHHCPPLATAELLVQLGNQSPCEPPLLGVQGPIQNWLFCLVKVWTTPVSPESSSSGWPPSHHCWGPCHPLTKAA